MFFHTAHRGVSTRTAGSGSSRHFKEFFANWAECPSRLSWRWKLTKLRSREIARDDRRLLMVKIHRCGCIRCVVKMSMPTGVALNRSNGALPRTGSITAIAAWQLCNCHASHITSLLHHTLRPLGIQRMVHRFFLEPVLNVYHDHGPPKTSRASPEGDLSVLR